MERRLRRAEWLGLAIVFAVILLIVLWPTPVDRPYDSALRHTLVHLHADGFPRWIDYDFVETSANVIMFAPLGALIASVAMPRLWWSSGVLGLTLSLAVEFTQAEFLPQRFASASDLAANTSGALLGGAVFALVRFARGGRRAQDQRHPHTPRPSDG
ncbi:VanZ family protein [Frondihabitans australicus]|uniref:VanZ like protein n=1 Tax=Frondihabitans australicus TaxID=386892 RepID=A0A495IF04_9MICO|nr:VanZ family protein [Frondihabitans australicus]RKR74584.1 VanZ like protein [Frondihabitans australicus]